MKNKIRSSRDVIIQTDNWAKAIEFYETILGFPVTHQGPTLMGFETDAFCLYVEKGNRLDRSSTFLCRRCFPQRAD